MNVFDAGDVCVVLRYEIFVFISVVFQLKMQN